MLEQIYTCQKTIFALRAGPLGARLDEFIPVLEGRGYQLRNVRSRYGVLASLSWWLVREKLVLRELTQEHIDRFIDFRKNEVDAFGELLSGE